ncbi:unnamed protein product [Adineta steineri]|uniref:Uncharacterized protein n=1 Tax=Adineta steineri TaxID=433720 RepID=A0A815EXE8_9BILA|nr:unnamed protein product [Adineta steineri]CAF1317358.1 unnamed protein product [Adineta steineri]CAF3554521.1 unnamed protein product [Adineta steineri]CAF3586868.1 unnamed protein product [Adineta steineri]
MNDYITQQDCKHNDAKMIEEEDEYHEIPDMIEVNTSSINKVISNTEPSSSNNYQNHTSFPIDEGLTDSALQWGYQTLKKYINI